MNGLPPADLSKLKGILGKAKNLIKTVDSGNFETGNVDSTSLTQDVSNYVNEGPQNTNTNQVQSLGNPVRKIGTPTIEAINNSNFPDAVKKLMIENQIQQPVMNHTFGLDDVSDLLDENPKPTPVAKLKKPSRVNEQVSRDGSKLLTITEDELRGIVKDELIKHLTTEYSKNLTENTIKKTINTLIKEGKIRTKK